MPDPVYVQHGHIVADDAIASPADPPQAFLLLRLASDGSRRVIEYEPEQGGEPHPKEFYQQPRSSYRSHARYAGGQSPESLERY